MIMSSEENERKLSLHYTLVRMYAGKIVKEKVSCYHFGFKEHI